MLKTLLTMLRALLMELLDQLLRKACATVAG